ncbi:MAG: hypothetical protein II919_05670 [Lachnospiraceae bacterium]|nr:hypothetical protein [Lachnospiraceae bacterium]MBQ3665575.1 hypothetical protein [Lachnospiraceae bacterium]
MSTVGKQFLIKLADQVIRVVPVHDYVREYCRDYLLEDDHVRVDLEIRTTKDDIQYERKKAEQMDLKEGNRGRKFSDEYLETLAVYRKIAQKMLRFNTFLFHGSVVAVDNEAYLFTANSGTGKSTHAKLWMDLLQDRAVMVNDDKPLIKIDGNHVIVYGTPYNGKHRLGNNIQVPLKAICILTRASENTIEEITKREAYPILMQQIYRPLEVEELEKTFECVDRLVEGVKLYRLGCNMEIEAARIAYEKMNSSG